MANMLMITVKVNKLTCFEGALSWRFLCVLVETAQIFDKVPFCSHQIAL